MSGRLPIGLLLAAAMLMALPASADELPAKPADLKFAAFFKQPVGRHGLEMSEALLAADGRRVRIVGYMVARERLQTGRFLLTPRPVHMSEDADGEADDLPPATLTVLLPSADRQLLVAHRPGLIAVIGRLEVGRAEDESGRVSWVRLMLEPQGLRIEPAATPAAAPSSP